MNAQDTKPPTSTSFFDQHLIRWSAIATILALAVALYFGIKAKDKRAIEIAYLGKLSLITAEPGYSDKLKIQFGTQDVRSLTKLVARISNTGVMPIEHRDVEQPITFPFSSGRVLESKIVEKSPPHLQADLSFKSNQVTVTNGLLNPGDFVRLEILCEGDPGWPQPIFRITGVSDANLVVPDVKRPLTRVTVYYFSKPTTFGVLAICSIVPALLLIAAPFAITDSVSPFFKQRPDLIKEIDKALDPEIVIHKLLIDVREEFVPYKLTLYTTHPSKWFDDIDALAALIQSEVPTGKQSKPVAYEIRTSLLLRLPEGLASQLEYYLPSTVRNAFKRQMTNERPEPDAKLTDLLSQARERAVKLVMPSSIGGRLKLIDYGDLWAAFLFLIFGCSGVLVLGASWLNLLGK